MSAQQELVAVGGPARLLDGDQDVQQAQRAQPAAGRHQLGRRGQLEPADRQALAGEPALARQPAAQQRIEGAQQPGYQVAVRRGGGGTGSGTGTGIGGR